MKKTIPQLAALLLFSAAIPSLEAEQPAEIGRGSETEWSSEAFTYKETRELVQLVNDAADLLHEKGEGAFSELRAAGSRWRRGEMYLFVLDPAGNMLLHPDPALEGKSQLELKDIQGRSITRGLIAAAAGAAEKAGGWYHYQWPVPGGPLPRWKSSYVRLAADPSGKHFIVGSGIYNDRMERSFVVSLVKDAVADIEKNGAAAFARFHDEAGPFRPKESYVFVIDAQGSDLVNPGFPNLEGRNILDLKDTQGKALVREMLDVAEKRGSGWVEYMWPKPGESVSTLKSTYVTRTRLGATNLIVGCGAYLADAPKTVSPVKKTTAAEVMQLVREGAALLEKEGEQAYPEFRKKGSKWFRDETYLFVRTMDEKMAFHAANPALEGSDMSGVMDVARRPYGKMFLQAAKSPEGEGWVHYMYPEPGNIFPIWKSTFVKRVTHPSGQKYILGCGIYNMEMDEAFIKDLVDHAAALIAERGRESFAQLRDKTGFFFFHQTYVFVDDLQGTELVNAAQPSMEGTSMIDMKDINGKLVVREFVKLASKEGSGWVDYFWYKPGDNAPARKRSYVRKAQYGEEKYIVGSGFYPRDNEIKLGQVQKTSWDAVKKEQASDLLQLQTISRERATIARYDQKCGPAAARHSHLSEEHMWVVSGALKYVFDDRELVAKAGEVVSVPPNIAHALVALEDTVAVGFFAPAREDWIRGEDQYFRR